MCPGNKDNREECRFRHPQPRWPRWSWRHAVEVWPFPPPAVFLNERIILKSPMSVFVHPKMHSTIHNKLEASLATMLADTRAQVTQHEPPSLQGPPSLPASQPPSHPASQPSGLPASQPPSLPVPPSLPASHYATTPHPKNMLIPPPRIFSLTPPWPAPHTGRKRALNFRIVE